MTSAAYPKSDSWIALEGLGTISFCLQEAVTEINEDLHTNQEGSPVAILESMNRSDLERLLDTFGQAVLDTQSDGNINKMDLHASLVGWSGCCNRIGQNWRVISDSDVVLAKGDSQKTAAGGTRKSTGSSTAPKSMSFNASKIQILAYGDR
jgi:hypothetical protein